MFNRNRKRLSAEVFSSAGSQPKQNVSNQNGEENGSTVLRNTREKVSASRVYEVERTDYKAVVLCHDLPWYGVLHIVQKNGKKFIVEREKHVVLKTYFSG